MKLTVLERQARNEVLGKRVDQPFEGMTVSPGGLLVVPVVEAPVSESKVQADADEAMKILEQDPPSRDPYEGDIRMLLDGLRRRDVL